MNNHVKEQRMKIGNTCKHEFNPFNSYWLHNGAISSAFDGLIMGQSKVNERLTKVYVT